MYSVPIIPQSILNNSEFSKVYNLELNNGMFDPTLKAPNYFTGDNRTVYYTDGHEKQMELFKNNHNTQEDQKTTEDQYKQYVNNQKVLEQPISEQEAEIDMYSNTRLDPRLRNEMVMEEVLKRAEQEQKDKELKLNEAQIRRERFYPTPKTKTADQRFYEKYNIR